MSTIPSVYIIDIPSEQNHRQVIELPSDYREQVITIRAGKSTQVLVVCTGINLVGSLHIDIQMEHANACIKIGVAGVIRDNNRYTITTTQRHDAPNTASYLCVRKIVCDKSFAQYRGIIHVAKNAMGSVVSQDDKTLFDGICAGAESVPAIEVLTDDVICTHGSALGRIDAGSLWYMQTRGLSYQEATEIWYSAFLNEVQQVVFE
jgi:Fe-S cluster assembly protein SufD